jgi:hypothetical protein
MAVRIRQTSKSYNILIMAVFAQRTKTGVVSKGSRGSNGGVSTRSELRVVWSCVFPCAELEDLIKMTRQLASVSSHAERV